MYIWHSSASKATAKATAEVSEPPLPRVVMSPSSLIPWKPVMTGVMSADMSLRMFFVSIELILAFPW